MAELKWNLDNFEFWTESIKLGSVYGLNSSFYNEKFEQLLENDVILADTISTIDEEYERLVEYRVKYEELIPYIKESIHYDLNSYINIYELFNAYSDGMKFFYLNRPIELENIEVIVDSNTYIDEDNDGVYDYVIVNGVKIIYDEYINSGGVSTPTSGDLVIIGNEELNMCGEEFTYVTTEYNFC
jgi:hypothetical protein